MRASFTALLLLCAGVEAAFAPSRKATNNDRHVLAAQSTLTRFSEGGFIIQEQPDSPPSPVLSRTLKGNANAARRPERLVSPSTKPAPSTAKVAPSRDMIAAKKKMIEEKRHWEAEKELEVKSRVSMLRERNASRLAKQRPRIQSDAINAVRRPKSWTPSTGKASLSPLIAGARQSAEEKRQLAKWEAKKNVEVKSRVSMLRERNARLARNVLSTR